MNSYTGRNDEAFSSNLFWFFLSKMIIKKWSPQAKREKLFSILTKLKTNLLSKGKKKRVLYSLFDIIVLVVKRNPNNLRKS